MNTIGVAVPTLYSAPWSKLAARLMESDVHQGGVALIYFVCVESRVHLCRISTEITTFLQQNRNKCCMSDICTCQNPLSHQQRYTPPKKSKYCCFHVLIHFYKGLFYIHGRKMKGSSSFCGFVQRLRRSCCHDERKKKKKYASLSSTCLQFL